jgi:hypothetical protein
MYFFDLIVLGMEMMATAMIGGNKEIKFPSVR